MLINPIIDRNKVKFIPVDEWVAEPEDQIFRHTKGAIIVSVSEFYGIESGPLDLFVLSNKRSYNSQELREHICQYLNYFEKFYDPDKELLAIYFRLKYLIDYEKSYTKEAFFFDIRRYILDSYINNKVENMNIENFNLNLTYRNKRSPALQYNNIHGQILLKISLLMNICIPLLTHFIYVNKIQNVNGFLLEIYDILLDMYNVDIYNKLYETSTTNVAKSGKNHSLLWSMQDIRGNNLTTHSLSCVNNIILNIMPKYQYCQNIIHFNYRSIINNTAFQITDIGYEFQFVPLSSSKRDEDNNSEFDKFESYLVKADEALYLQNKVSCEQTMRSIELIYGPFEDDEINFYMKELTADSRNVINSFQKDMIFNLFYKHFGDSTSIRAINIRDYVKLMIASKRILEANGMIILPYIISSRVNRLVTRKNMNKKELTKLETSPLYAAIRDKYKNDKIEKQILGIIAIILSSEFQIIDYNDPELNGKKIEIIPEYICEEVLMYINLI